MESILPWSTSAMIIMPFLATSDFTAFVTSSNDLLEDTVTRSPLNESGAAATKDRRPGRGSGRCAPAGGRPGDLHRWRNASPVVSDPNDAAVDGFGEHTLDAFLWGQWYGNQATGDR